MANCTQMQGFYLLKISFNDFSIRPVIISYENRKMLIDWESFIGYSEMSLDEFVDNKLKEPTMFRFHAKIDDYFNYIMVYTRMAIPNIPLDYIWIILYQLTKI